MNILLCSLAGEALTLVPAIRDKGDDCIVWIKDKSSQAVGDGLVWKTSDPDSLADQADLIVFTENGMGTIADRYRARGLPVWNGGTFVEKLEYDRLYGMEVCRSLGIPIPDTFDVSSVEEVKSVVQSEFSRSEKLVIKLSGSDGAGSAFSYCAKNREDLLAQVTHWETDSALPVKWKGIIQRFVEGIEVSVEAWWSGEEWSNHNITIEEKKCWTGNLGPSVGCAFNTIFPIKPDSRLFKMVLDPVSALLKENGYVGQIDTNSIVDESGIPHALEFTPRCYSSDTEVLTVTGWRPIVDVVPGEIVAGLSDDGELIFEEVERKILRYHEGEVIRVHSKNVYDLIVTPDHDMVVQDQSGSLRSVRADKMSRHGERTVRTARWIGADLPTYRIPDHVEQRVLGRHKKTMPISHPGSEVGMEDWCRFLGLFVAEGFVHKKGGVPYQVHVAQTKFVQQCRDIMEALGFKVGYYGHQLTINSTLLARHLHSLFGDAKAPKKRIPRFILDLAPKYIAAFLDGFCLGDGTIHKRSGQRTFFTTSKGLADDLAECIFRIGHWSRTVHRKSTPSTYGKDGCYAVSERIIKKDGRIFPKRHVTREHYSGNVVCLTVPHHRLYVRRPGGPSIWGGNCGYDATPTLLWMGAASYGMPADAAPELRAPFAAGVRVHVSPYPFECKSDKLCHEVYQTAEGVPIDIPEAIAPDFYLFDAKKDDTGGVVCSGSSGIIGLAMGGGGSPKEAGLAAYRVAEKVGVPNRAFRSLDGYKRAESQIPDLLAMKLIKLI